ncbi:MAG TPA: hypothetical protein VJT69_11195 [Pyrinomonadaceae bacterium]|nr:hypothetical protein [Pyrinomonadaceae bacterium]
MFRISIFREPDGKDVSRFSAFTSTLRSSGRTLGEALDALTTQHVEKDSTAVVQFFHPDQFFSAANRDELSSLMDNWRRLRSINQSLPSSEQEKLESLVDEELQAAGERAGNILVETENLPFQFAQMKSELRNRYEAEKRRLSQLRIVIFLFLAVHMAALLSTMFFIWRGSLAPGLLCLLIGSLGAIVGFMCFRLQHSVHEQTIDLLKTEINLNQLLLMSEALESKLDASKH